mmetsp:Transcript_18556/g.31219  ORF Transcript_18556/g.31219 Transcript_18556/m.31219 type:complete len:424 (+) Transcript_18556:55-1326(+)
MRVRKTSRRTSLTHRHLSLTSLEQMNLKQVRKYILMIWKLKVALRSSPLPIEVRQVHDALVGVYLSVKFTDQDRNRTRTNDHHHVTIEEISDSDCRTRYLFTKEQLVRLHKALRLDRWPEVKLDNGSKFGSEEIMLIGLHRFVFPQRFCDMTSIYGRDWSALNRAFNWFCKYMRIHFSHLIYDNCEYWKPEFEYFAECVRKKVEEKSDGNIRFDPGSYCVFGFVDDTVIKTTRPGGGPCEEGPNAARFNTLIQMAFYSGYKKHHGIKYQTLELPNGLCMDAFGPCSFRQNDLEVLGLSNLNNRLADLNDVGGKQYKTYCDGIFPVLSHMLSKHIGATTREQRYENGIMTKIRIGNEWAYGITGNLFSLINWSYGLRLRQNREHANYFAVATILRNAHCCLNGSNISQYFNCYPPSLENYFGIE